MSDPVATYRLQFHNEFTFEAFGKIIPYLKELGVSTVYASPIFSATPGSTHGYDGTNPNEINPEIGTLEQLKELHKDLQEEKISWLQDIVPNHMAFHQQNEWLMDVLEKGPQSIYSSYFDVAWNSQLYRGRLMVPFLGKDLNEAIEQGEIKITFDGSRFVFDYFGSVYPLQPKSYEVILGSHTGKMPESLKQLLAQFPKQEDETSYFTQWDEIRKQLTAQMKNKTVKTFVEKCLEKVNQEKDLLTQIADQQSYRLCHWQETDYRINYRRFFTVNGLICMNIQDEKVFDTYHQLIKDLVKEGIFQGLRVDHIDGLYDPSQYLDRLRNITGEDGYIVVEKILEQGESLPDNWAIEGNTGYDFLSLVNNLLTLKPSEKKFTEFYKKLVKDKSSLQQQIYDKKSYLLFQHMAGELQNLFHMFMELNIVDKRAFASIRKDDLKEAIGEFLVQCPVYRYYSNKLPLPEQEAQSVRTIFNRIRKTSPDIQRAVNILEDCLLQKPLEGNEERNERTARFYQRCMQFTGPLMAKGVEDTLMYTYNRFIGHNEVGDSPESFGISIEDFHHAMMDRQKNWPYSLNATSTHDTKRGEDVRARLNVLTDIPDEWFKNAGKWIQAAESFRKEGNPDVNDIYMILQNIVGAFPLDKSEEEQFAGRIEEYIQKALREAKTHSNWTEPDESYEQAAKNVAITFLDKNQDTRKEIEEFVNNINEHGILNSLTQVLLKFTCPGVPDVYQGCELWDLSLVDPDNRRPVDYEKRMQLLHEIASNPENSIEQLWSEKESGKIKLWLVHTLYQLRKDQPELFTQGAYVPLKTEGTYKNNVLAFARSYRQRIYIIAVPLHTAVICKEQKKGILEIDWKDTRIILPKDFENNLEPVFGTISVGQAKELKVRELFGKLPISVLKGQVGINERGAGILLHISSLPSPFGIGDMGPEAKSFVDFLHRSKQKYWQLLPMNPTEAGQGHSPYSAISSRAGNPLLISPELLAQDNLLNISELLSFHVSNGNKVNYSEAERVKEELLQRAYDRFNQIESSLHDQFKKFCEHESEWLNDFAMYMVIKKEQQGKPWFQWPESLKLRDEKALQEFADNHQKELEAVKWKQFIFFKQWKNLKTYCNKNGIQMIGDLPFYISYDSSDVWSHKELFALDEEGAPTGLAGVPPDAFSADGQLWGMPVFNWDAIKEQDFAWWIQRIKVNRELFDLVRIDHFRAFADYWEVPGGEQTAKNGKWKQGPGASFFEAIEKELNELPFVAEDLGEVNDAVFGLRDQFHLPGMKVLQFAFGEDMPTSDYIPHNHTENFLVYTGTHDNNTIRGWYRKDADSATKKRVEQYLGRTVGEQDIHWIMARLAYSSRAKIAILPMQDVLGLDESARMNVPSSGSDNWAWRLTPGQVNEKAEQQLQEWTWLYNRG